MTFQSQEFKELFPFLNSALKAEEGTSHLPALSEDPVRILPAGEDMNGKELRYKVNSGFKVYSALDALEPLPSIKWYVDGVISEGSLTLLVGEPGSKKTYAMLTLGVSVASGEDWAGRTTTQGKVLFIDEESGISRLLDRVGKVMRGSGIANDIPIRFVSLEGFELTNEKGVKEFRALVDQERPNLIIIDALADIIPGADENSVKDVQPVFLALRKIADDTKAAIIIIHHTNKSGGYRGSSAMKGAVDMLLTVDSPNNRPNLTFKSEKFRDGEPIELKALANFEGDRFWLSIDDKLNAGSKLTPVEEFITRFLSESGPSYTDQIVKAGEQAGFKGEYVRQSINSKSLKGLVYRVDHGSSGKRALYDVKRDNPIM